MQDWNVLVTVREDGFKRALRFFKEFGPISKTGFFNVLVLKASNVDRMMQVLGQRASEDPGILGWLARVVPITHQVSFQTGEELESGAREILRSWAPELAGKRFHVRVHRRGMKGKVSSWEMEKRLNEFLIEELDKLGTSGHIAFESPDVVIAVETLGPVAGLSFWTKENLREHPFLRFDTGPQSLEGRLPEKTPEHAGGEAHPS